jgi:hypothetical protein
VTGKPLDLTQRQIRAIAEGAKKAGCIAELQIGKALVRIIPEEHAIPARPDNDVDRYKDVVP